jgi:periplasmic divalent cation tolerance protein
MNEILILTTADSPQLAHGIATALVEAHAAACVNIIPSVRSIYRWKGDVCDEAEFLLLVKSTRDHFETVCSCIRRVHSYEVPEIIAVPLEAGDSAYLKWLHEQLI